MKFSNFEDLAQAIRSMRGVSTINEALEAAAMLVAEADIGEIAPSSNKTRLEAMKEMQKSLESTSDKMGVLLYTHTDKNVLEGSFSATLQFFYMSPLAFIAAADKMLETAVSSFERQLGETDDKEFQHWIQGRIAVACNARDELGFNVVERGRGKAN